MLVYSLVNQSVEEFAIDNYTGQIKSNSVAGKNGTFHIEVQAMDPSGLFKQTIVQVSLISFCSYDNNSKCIISFH